MDETLKNLFKANAKWAQDMKAADPGFFEKSLKGQYPKILWLGCSDSRVPESVITASRPGDIFVHRNIANQVHLTDDNILSVITYAVAKVGVEHILVVGHSNCGGAEECLKVVNKEIPAPDPATPLARWLKPLTELVKNLKLQGVPPPEALSMIVDASVRAQVENVARMAAVTNVWAPGSKKKLWVHGLVYELKTGTLKNLNVTRGPPA